MEQGLKEMVEYIRAKGTKKFRYHLDLEIMKRRQLLGKILIMKSGLIAGLE